ncbi:MAG: sulfatase [Thermoleophilia bacterium]|nr:sulfatase [Thermoleophilia bacterium]
MSRPSVVFAVAFVLALIGMFAAALPAKSKVRKLARPNIVVIQSDDAIRGDLAYMPNLRRLVQNGGTNYSNFVAPYPLCGPARASFLTGQLSHNNQVLSNFNSNDGGHYRFKSFPGKLNQRNSLGPWLHRSGYRTAMVGKYLNEYGALGRTEVPPGWDRWAGLLDNSTYDYFNFAMNVDGKIKYYGDRDYATAQMNLATDNANNPPNNFAELLQSFCKAFDPCDYFGTQDESVYTMDVGGGYAARFIRKSAPGKRPFFLYYTPPGPHAEDTNHAQGFRPGAPEPDPRPPARYRDTYDNTALPKPASFNEADVSDKAENLKDLPLLSDTQIDTITDNYRGRLGAVRSVDDQIGKIVKQLKRAKELNNTYIVFDSDNGYMQGEHRLRASKFLPYENSIRIPLLIRGPGVRAGKTLTGPAMDVDVTRTVLDMADVKPGRVMDGISLLPSAKGKQKLPKRNIPLQAMRPLLRFTTPITAFDLPYYGVRTSQYKYIHWSFDGANTELYDLKKDPDELVNLVNDPAQAGNVARLEAMAVRLSECRGSNCR